MGKFQSTSSSDVWFRHVESQERAKYFGIKVILLVLQVSHYCNINDLVFYAILFILDIYRYPC